MRTNEIVHINGRYKKIDCDLIDQCHVCVRLKTGKDIRRVEVVYNDPYIRYEGSNGLVWPNYVVDMKRTGETFDSYYFSVVLPCESHRLKYYFKIYDDYECLQFSESGFTKNYRDDDLSMFFIPYITESNIFKEPKWVGNVVWYQIMPTRFKKNLRGVIDKLDYLKELGINGLYLNPIYYAHSYHKYDVIDYMQVDPELGTEKDFKELCDKAHDLGMKVMLDISFTHCSDENEMFKDAIEKRKQSEYWPMFKIEEDKQGHLRYEMFGMIRSMPKFETENFKTADYFINKVVKKWMELGVDAWRLDVANEISDGMLLRLNNYIHNYKEETYIVGEIWHNATEWISNNALDGVTNYAVSRAILAFVCDPNHDIWKYRSSIDELMHSYTLKQLKSSMPLLDSHDTPRIRNICQNDKDKVKLCLLLLLTFYGTPSIYYGTERYMEGGSDPDNRRPTNWHEPKESYEDIYYMTQLLIKLRKEHPVLANEGNIEWIHHNELLIMKRANENETLYIVVNTKEYTLNTTLPMQNEFVNIINNDTIYPNIEIQRLGFMILKPIYN